MHHGMSSRPLDAPLAETLPLRRQERVWGFGDFLWVQSGLAIATWSFLIGGVTANYVSFWDGLWTMLLGNCIGVIPMLFATAMPANKWGTEHYIAQRSIFGPLGVIFTIGTISLIAVGWITILAVMLGESTAKVLSSISGAEKSMGSLVTTSVAFLAIFAGWLVVTKGNKSFGKLNRYAAPGLILLSIVLLIAIFSRNSLAQVASAKPLSRHPERASNIMLAVELNIAAGMSWWSLAANVSRSAKTQRIALWASFLGYVPIAVLAQAVGLTAALVMSSSDPTDWIVPIVGRVVGIILLVLIGFANLTSLAGVAYASVQTIVQHLGPRVQKFGWGPTTGVLCLLCAASVFLTGTTLYEKFFVFAAWSQAVLSPAIGVTLADYYVLRHKQLSLVDLYDVEATSRYFFWNRMNYAALGSLAVGAVVYVLSINPATLVTAGIFNYTTASVPALAAAFISHVAVSKIVVIPAGKGGYR